MQRHYTDLIVFHCSATRPAQDIGRQQITEWHLSRGFTAIGYHYVIRRNGVLELGRPVEDIGAHVEGKNSISVGVCMVGGLDEAGGELTHNPEAFTPAQWKTAQVVVDFLRAVYPLARVVGHRDLSPDLDSDGKITRREWLKSCPGFDASVMFPL